MSAFFDALMNYGFMRNALATGLLVSVSCGIVGTYVVTRRITCIYVTSAHAISVPSPNATF